MKKSILMLLVQILLITSFAFADEAADINLSAPVRNPATPGGFENCSFCNIPSYFFADELKIVSNEKGAEVKFLKKSEIRQTLQFTSTANARYLQFRYELDSKPGNRFMILTITENGSGFTAVQLDYHKLSHSIWSGGTSHKTAIRLFTTESK